MKRPNENPLTPDSLAADGMQGAGANAVGVGKAEHSRTEQVALFAAAALMDAARDYFQDCALATDDPRPGVVEAADLLEAARAALAGEVPR
ncbi:hypothetical protein H5368_05060 [Luteimonas sp. MC1782]|uniref:hypothetical protein n=1 Tax=Luteimonas sp. MC1782 TaxID=2760305 RepID=UPI001603981E|nr:hypothetical protein [Luteimonas sp. MC1782]MBB1472392.1 hypothetical protein [Luteimonas sp. MC1782]